MKTKKQTKAKVDTWKDAPIAEVTVRALASVSGGRRIVVYETCGCGKCRRCTGS
jgi:hypothetical protein